MIFTVGAEKGGVGKSTVAFTLASYLASQKVIDAQTKKKRLAKVVLVDTDSTKTSTNWNAMRTQFGLDDLFTVVESTVQPIHVIIKLSAEFDAVVVDVGARDYDRLNELARISDLWIAPTKVGQGDLLSTVNMAHAFNTVNDKHKNGQIPLVVLVNGVPNVWNSIEGQDAIDALREAMPTGVVLNSMIRDRKVVRDAHKLGKSIFEMPAAQRAKAEHEFVSAITEAMSSFKK